MEQRIGDEFKIYQTAFRLTNPVNDFEKAAKYLEEDDMTSYFLSDYRCTETLRPKIVKIRWILRTTQSGFVEVMTNNYLTQDELRVLEDWIDGQNSDGLGEGFEQRNFATYCIDEENDEWVCASFDWERYSARLRLALD